ncbi:MAG: ester cyclase [Actinomycetota bacterium]
MSEEKKAIVRRLVEEWQDGRRVEVAEELIADDFVDHSAGPGEKGTKKEGIQWFQYIWQALPDFSVQIKGQVAEEDKVATLKTFSGTHEGELMGVPPTGRRVAFDIFDLLRIRDGKVVEHWGVYDIAGLMQQLGAMSGADGEQLEAV